MKIFLIILSCAIGVILLLMVFSMMKAAGEADDQMERWCNDGRKKDE